MEQENFDSYEVVSMADMPAVETIIMPSGGFWGDAGEPTIAVAAPAVLNAVFAAIGKRIRMLPLKTINWLDPTKVRRDGRFCAPVLLAALAAASPAFTDAPPGAAACTGCQGPAALGSAIPSLDDYAAADIVVQMQAFRAGQRPATVMDRIAKGFSEKETRAIAAWLAHPKAARHAQP